jgi:hypothetical protein
VFSLNIEIIFVAINSKVMIDVIIGLLANVNKAITNPELRIFAGVDQLTAQIFQLTRKK